MASEQVERVTQTERAPLGDTNVVREERVTRDSADAATIGRRIVYYIVGVIVAFLAVRIILLLLAANQGNAFVDFVYGVGGFFAAPFYGIFSYTPTYGSSVLEVSSVVGIIVYLLVGWGIGKLFTIGKTR